MDELPPLDVVVLCHPHGDHGVFRSPLAVFRREMDAVGPGDRVSVVTLPRTLVVIRHAEALSPAGAVDETRPLSQRGAADSQALGRWLHGAVTAPDLAICSDAVRTRQTWEGVTAGLEAEVPVRYEPRGYLASAVEWSELVAEVEDTDDPVRCLALIGHAPGVRELVVALLGDHAALTATALRGGFPCAAAVLVTVPVPWQGHAEVTCTLRAATVPGR